MRSLRQIIRRHTGGADVDASRTRIEGGHTRPKGTTGRPRLWVCAVAVAVIAAALPPGAAPDRNPSGDATRRVWVKVYIDSPAEGATTGRSVRVSYWTDRRNSNAYMPVKATCSLDGAAAVACPPTWGTTGRGRRRRLRSNSASRRYSGLAGGKHTVVVRVRDTATGARARATRSWTVDATGPTVYFESDQYMPEEGSTVDYNWAQFAWSTDDEDAMYASQSCRLDGRAWESCTWHYYVENLANGPHAFSVRGRDKYGNFGAPITRHWTVRL